MQLSTIYRRSLSTRRQAGDTIVEVLICIGVVSLILTGAFAIANASSSTVQDTNEHATASLYLQSQVEGLHAYLHSGATTTPPAEDTKLCMVDGSVAPVTFSAAACTKSDPAGYKLSFTRSGNDYTFVVTWDSVKGNTAQESYLYRDYI